MKFFRRVTLLIAFSAASILNVTAQDDINGFLARSADDGKKLIGAYVAPFSKSVALGLDQGWYNTAKPHKIAGFDLTITVNAMKIPEDQVYYNTDDLNLQELEHVQGPLGSRAPTIFGSEDGPVFRVQGDPDPNNTFELPGGIDMKKNVGANFVPVPMAHLGFGLPKNTDIKIRFVPKINLGQDGQTNLWGLGVMHDVKQWIPGIKNAPFDLSAFVGYTNFKLNYNIEETNVENGQAVYTMNATTIQGLISKKISVLTVYGGLGYNIAKSNIKLNGTYTLDADGNSATTNDQYEEVNPVDFKYAASGPRMTAGFRLKLAIFTLHADYTLQKYSCLSFGFGFCVR